MTSTHDTLRILGQVAQLIYKQQGREMPQGARDAILATPLTGLAMMQRDMPRNKPALTEAIGRVIQQLPADIGNGPVSVADQGGFWLGLYQAIALPDDVGAELQTTIHFDLPVGKKAAYVRAAQADGQKLVPWIIEALDQAAERAKEGKPRA